MFDQTMTLLALREGAAAGHKLAKKRWAELEAHHNRHTQPAPEEWADLHHDAVAVRKATAIKPVPKPAAKKPRKPA